MKSIVNFLSQPIVGSIIGILGIIIGAILAICFYFKAKNISKIRYTINNLKLIDLKASEIPNSITMNYGTKEIDKLSKTTIKIWNAGKKPVLRSELSPQYIEIPFGSKNLEIVSIKVESSSEYAKVDTPIVEDNNIKFAFDFLEYKDSITITLLHNSSFVPEKITGHVVGASNFVNVSEQQKELIETLAEMVTNGSSGIFETIAYLIANRFS